MDVTYDPDDNSVNQSQKKEDLFHMLNALLLGKKVPIKSAVSQLLIHATFIFCEQDFNSVAEFLKKTEIVDDNGQLLDHFYFNQIGGGNVSGCVLTRIAITQKEYGLCTILLN